MLLVCHILDKYSSVGLVKVNVMSSGIMAIYYNTLLLKLGPKRNITLPSDIVIM